MLRAQLICVWEELSEDLGLNERDSLLLWSEIENKYTGRNRYYHNLKHLGAMMDEVLRFKASIEQLSVLKLSIFYHDIIYNPLRKDNELRSAERMKSRLSKLGVATDTINRSFDQILLTKGHQLKESSTSDDEYFLDFDLTVLGEDWLVYAEYAKQIRKEYWIFPAKTYKEGRKKALASFLNRESIYFTPAFRETKEEQAQANLQREIDELLT